MSNKKKLFLGLAVLFCISLTITLSHWRVKEYYYRKKYDRNNSKKPIDTAAEIDEILKEFQIKKYAKLKKEYKKYTKSENSKYKSMLGQKSYFVLTRKDFFKRVVGHFRIEDFLAKDKYYRSALSDQSREYYWLMDKKLLYKLLELQILLEDNGYNKRGFGITNGHRHPQYNERIGGAKLSRHIKGEAIDIRIYDIDKNGRYEQKDKDIVLDLLERKVIGNQGGIGLYPGTRAVHFDVRGYRARWDSY